MILRSISIQNKRSSLFPNLSMFLACQVLNFENFQPHVLIEKVLIQIKGCTSNVLPSLDEPV